MPYLPSMDEDENDDDLLLEACQKDMRAVKEACRSFCDDDSDVNEEPACLVDDDDDVLLLSIQKRFGASRLAQQPPLSPSFAEEEDEEILRAVQERFSPFRKKTNAVKIHKAVGKGARTFKALCSLEGSTTNFHQKASVLEAQAQSDCYVTSSPDQIAEQSGFWQPEQAEDTAGGCCVSLSPIQGPHVSSSPIETPSKNLSPVQTPEQTRFRLPGQVEVFRDNFEGLSDDERVNGFSRGDDLPGNLLEDYHHKQSIRCTLDALKKNRLSQRVLTHKLALLGLKMEENRDLKKRVRALLDFQNVAKRKYALEEEYSVYDDDNTKRHRISGWPRIRAAESAAWGKCRPPENADVAKFRAMQKKYCLTFEPKSWTKEERIELVKGVQQQVQESFIRSAMDLYSASNNDATFLDDQVKTIAENPPTSEDIRKAMPTINWNEVSRLYVIGRSPTECWIQWSNHEDSLINHGAWTKAEDKKLWSIVKQHKLCNWDLIAQELGSRRSIAQCLVRYQRSLNAGIVRGAWTREEDEQLRVAVQQYGDQDWPSVASELEGRTGPQCWNRWHKSLNPIRQKSGRWSVNEDKRLRLAVSVYGPRMWKFIAVHVPGRTEVQCRERWCNVLDPSLTWAEWTPEEDQRLEAAVARHGSHRWSTVASEVSPRTDSQCWRRWKHLHPELILAFQKDNKIQRAALVSNFVGRKSERSKLCPSDFVPEPGAFDTNEEDREQDDSSVMERGRFCEKGTTSDTPRAEGGPHLATPELSKRRRLERSQKIREARATGKLLAWKRSAAKGKRLNAKGRCKPSKNGATAFVKAMKELANICETTQKSSGAGLVPMSTSEKIQDNQSKAAESFSNLDVGEAGKGTPQCAGEDEEVETAVKAVLSWPFIYSLQGLLDKALRKS